MSDDDKHASNASPKTRRDLKKIWGDLDKPKKPRPNYQPTSGTERGSYPPDKTPYPDSDDRILRGPD